MTRSVGPNDFENMSRHRHVQRLVTETPVAPHRYLWDAEHVEPVDNSMKAWRATLPYQPGEVVWVQVGSKLAKRARITQVLCDHNAMHERMPRYKVQLETRKGTWSTQWRYTWPGFIQRGYAIAGLAPDVPADEVG